MWIRLRQIAMLTNDLEATVDNLKAVFGLEVGFDDPEIRKIGLENRLIPVGNQLLEVITPRDPATTQARFLERWGDTGYMVICQASEQDQARRRCQELSIRIVGGPPEVVDGRHLLTQLHPKDTGGSFLELDWHADGDAEVPPWEHGAGFNWQDAIRTDRVRSISGVEMRATDPKAVAARWSEVFELPSSASSTGEFGIELDNAGLEFQPTTDPRGDGISALWLEAVDRDAILATARERGLIDDDGEIRICGVRFGLRP